MNHLPTIRDERMTPPTPPEKLLPSPVQPSASPTATSPRNQLKEKLERRSVKSFGRQKTFVEKDEALLGASPPGGGEEGSASPPSPKSPRSPHPPSASKHEQDIKLNEAKKSLVDAKKRQNTVARRGIGMQNALKERRVSSYPKHQMHHDELMRRSVPEPALHGRSFNALAAHHTIPNSPEFDLKSKLPNQPTSVRLQFTAKSLRAGTNVKPNQDSFVCIVNKDAELPYSLLVVCDGHGKQGHIASQIAINMLGCICHPVHGGEGHLEWQQQRLEAMVSQLMSHPDTPTYPDPRLVRLQARIMIRLQDIETVLKTHPIIDMHVSGTTLCAALVTCYGLMSFNLGDSRAIVGHIDDHMSVKVKEITWDQKPCEPRERSRVLSVGGEIDSFRDRRGAVTGPERLWFKLNNGSSQGIAMTRSLGDIGGKGNGLSSDPVVEFHSLNPNREQFVVIASDGLWDMVTTEEAIRIVSENKSDLSLAAKAIREYAVDRWMIEEGIVCDDVTILITRVSTARSQDQGEALQARRGSCVDSSLSGIAPVIGPIVPNIDARGGGPELPPSGVLDMQTLSGAMKAEIKLGGDLPSGLDQAMRPTSNQVKADEPEWFCDLCTQKCCMIFES